MFTTFIIVFLTTFFIVFIIRIAIRKFADINDPGPVRSRRTAPPFESAPTRIFTIERTSEFTVVNSHRAPPPDYNQSILNDIQLPASQTKQFFIISDKDLPSYEEVIAQKIQETTVNNNSPSSSNSATSSTTTTIQQSISDNLNIVNDNGISTNGNIQVDNTNSCNNIATRSAATTINTTTVDRNTTANSVDRNTTATINTQLRAVSQ